MAFLDEFKRNITRRHFFSQGSHLLGTATLASLMGDRVLGASSAAQPAAGAMPTGSQISGMSCLGS